MMWQSLVRSQTPSAIGDRACIQVIAFEFKFHLKGTSVRGRMRGLMLSVNLPDPNFQRMELVAEPRVEKGSSTSLLQVSSWIELADPQYSQLSTTPVDDDKELEHFLAANKGQYRYDYVRLGCSFCPQNGERFEKAFLSVTLKPDGPPPPEVPISWSLFPLTNYQTGKETTSAKIGASAQILSAEIGGSSEIETRQYSLRGFREGKPNPYWELYSNQTEPPGRGSFGSGDQQPVVCCVSPEAAL